MGLYSILIRPFVRNADDLKAVRKALKEADAEHIRLLAKIENHQGTDHIRELLPHADEFVIARGDLGNSMPLWNTPRFLHAQKSATSSMPSSTARTPSW